MGERATARQGCHLSAAAREVGADNMGLLVVGCWFLVPSCAFPASQKDGMGLRRLPLRRSGFVANGYWLLVLVLGQSQSLLQNLHPLYVTNVVNVVGVVVGMGLSDTCRSIRFANFCNFFKFCTGILYNLRILRGVRHVHYNHYQCQCSTDVLFCGFEFYNAG